MSVWRICGYDGIEPLFERTIAAGSMTNQEMTTLLQRLASRHLSDDEIVSASMRTNANGYAPHLEVLLNHQGSPGLMVSGGRYSYIASIVDGN